MVHFQYFHRNIYVLYSCYLSALIFATIAYQNTLYHSCMWVLRRGLEGERNERLSEWRKTFRITVHSLSKKNQFRSALQIANFR